MCFVELSSQKCKKSAGTCVIVARDIWRGNFSRGFIDGVAEAVHFSIVLLLFFAWDTSAAEAGYDFGHHL